MEESTKKQEPETGEIRPKKPTLKVSVKLLIISIVTVIALYLANLIIAPPGIIGPQYSRVFDHYWEIFAEWFVR